jgi:hypothetical protein
MSTTRRVPVWAWIVLGLVGIVVAIVLAPLIAALALVVLITGIVALSKRTPTWLRLRSRTSAVAVTVAAAAVFVLAGSVSAAMLPTPDRVRDPGAVVFVSPTPSGSSDPASPAAQPSATPLPTTAAPTTTPSASAPTKSSSPTATPTRTATQKPAPTTPKPAPAKPKPAPTTAKPAAPQVYYKNCSAVRAAGKAPLHVGDPGYSTKLDRDGDGVACE